MKNSKAQAGGINGELGESLKEQIERENEIREILADAKMEILRGYFAKRSYFLPQNTNSIFAYEPKSTMDIVEELDEMASFQPYDIILFMKSVGYKPTTEDDGNVRWAIWRELAPVDGE